MYAMRLVLLIAALAGPSSARAADVPRVELFGGYGYARGGGARPRLEPSEDRHGFEASLAWNFGGHLGLVADASRHGGSVGGADLTRWHFLAGPRVWFRAGPITFFVHALGGARRTREALTVVDLTIAESSTAMGAAAGGGIDVGLSDLWAVRLQGDLTVAKVGGATFKDPRAAAGLVLRVGRK